MQITCPGCGFGRDVPDEKLPQSATLATCPKCAKKFKFRDLPVFRPYDRQSPIERGYAPPAEPVRPEPEIPAMPDEPVRPKGTYVPPSDIASDPAEDFVASASEPEEPAPARTGTRMAAGDLIADNFGEPGDAAPQAREMERKAPEAQAFRDGKPVRKISLEDETGHPSKAGSSQSARFHDDDGDEPYAPPERLGASARAKEMAGGLWSKLRRDQSAGPGEDEDFTGGFAMHEDEEDFEEDLPGGFVPFEHRDRYGFFRAFLLTLKMIVLSPGRFFSALSGEGRGGFSALLFALLVVELVLLTDFAWSLAGPLSKFFGPGRQALGLLRDLAVFPLTLGALSFVDAASTVILLRILRTPDVSFADTHRLLCYSAASVAILAVPAPVGVLMPVLLFWNIALQAVGVRAVNRISLVYSLAMTLIKWTIYLVLVFAASQALMPR